MSGTGDGHENDHEPQRRGGVWTSALPGSRPDPPPAPRWLVSLMRWLVNLGG